MFQGFMLLQAILIKPAQHQPLALSVTISGSIPIIKSVMRSLLERTYMQRIATRLMIIMKRHRSNLVNVIKMMPYMPVYDPTTSDGFRGVNSVLDGGDPTNPIEDAIVKNPGHRTGT